ncbi:MAG: ThuA domain-containing protein [Desulfobacterales bacterium]
MFAWQRPLIRDPAEVERIVGPAAQEEPSRHLNILWVWGVDKDHDKGIHAYDWAMDLFVNKLLPNVPGLTAVQTMHFPTKEQWATADLVVFFSGLDKVWEKKHYDLIDSYQERGGGLIFLHLALLQASGEELAKRIGLAFGTGSAPNGPTKFGVLPSPVALTAAAADNPIFEGFPPDLELVDELYWNLTGDPEKVTTLVTSPAGPEFATSGPPKPEDLDGKAWPVMWTMERGPGRVFATVLGHNYFSFNDPFFRIILLRAMAWAMKESFDPFKPLVEMHIG